MFKAIGTAMLVLWACAAAAGQTHPTTPSTRPADWTEDVRRFAQALVDADQQAIDRLLARDASIKPFKPDAPAGVQRLQAKAHRATIIAARAYRQLPQTLAGDLADDISRSDILPDDLRQSMVPADDEQMQRANATAAKWVSEVLSPAGDQPVGIILLWCNYSPPVTARSAIAPPPELVFILLKGQLTDSGHLTITHIVYGDPLVQ